MKTWARISIYANILPIDAKNTRSACCGKGESPGLLLGRPGLSAVGSGLPNQKRKEGPILKRTVCLLFACFICFYLTGCAAVTTTTQTMDPGLRRISVVGGA